MFTRNMFFQSSVVQLHFCNKINVKLCVVFPVSVFVINTCSLLTITAASGSEDRRDLTMTCSSGLLEAADMNKCLINNK